MSRVPLSLTLAAITPFIAFAVTVATHIFPTHMVVELLLTYAAVVVSFMGGIHWGVAVARFGENKRISNLLIAESIWPSLIAWGVLFTAEIHIQLLVLTLIYTLLWAIDSILYSNNLIPQWFFNLRCIVTPIVVVSLYVSYFGMI